MAFDSTTIDYGHITRYLNIAFEYTKSDIIDISRVSDDDQKRTTELVTAIVTSIGDDSLSRISSIVEAQALWDEIVGVSEYAGDWIIQAANSWYLMCGFSRNSYLNWMNHIANAYSSYQSPITEHRAEDIDTCTFSDELFDSMAEKGELVDILSGNMWLVFLFTLQPSLSKLILELNTTMIKIKR